MSALSIVGWVLVGIAFIRILIQGWNHPSPTTGMLLAVGIGTWAIDYAAKGNAWLALGHAFMAGVVGCLCTSR